MKKYFLILIALILLTSCGGNKGYITGEEAAKMGTPKGDVDTDICKQFDADFVYSATGKTIVKVEPSAIPTVYACDYYTDYKEDFYKDEGSSVVMPGGPSINIVLDNLNVEKQKEGVKFLGATLGEDPRINMDHYIVYREDGSIWSIDLIINPNRFIWTDYSNKAITDDELIQFAAKMADRIQGHETLDIQKNPVASAEPAEKETIVPLPSNEDIVRNFFNLINDHKIQEALAMMDANEDTKQGWGVNFNLIKSLKIDSIEPAFQEEWTDSRVTYKIALDAQVKEVKYGWENGKNFRWVTLEKADGKWLVHELANNP